MKLLSSSNRDNSQSLRNPTEWNRQSGDTLDAFTENSSLLKAENNVESNIGKAVAGSLHSEVNHRLALVLRYVGLSLAIGIAAGVLTCLLGPLLCSLCLACIGFRSEGIAQGRFHYAD